MLKDMPICRKSLLLLLLLCRLAPGLVVGQTTTPVCLFRIYEDNDFMNITMEGTDQAYSNGTRLDMFFTKDHPSRFFLDRWMPKASDSAVNVFGYSLMQQMYTPEDIRKAYYMPDDYYYAGALFLTHSLASYSPQKKVALQSELLLGIRGPASLAGAAQKFVHNMMGYIKPRGWDNQLNTLPLINLNLGLEKQALQLGSGWLELHGGAQLNAGTMLTQATVYPLLRIGKMTPYYKGTISQYSVDHGAREGKRAQLYAFFRPRLGWVLNNAMVHGERMNADRPLPASQEVKVVDRSVQHLVTELEYGAVLAIGRFGISYTQKHNTEYYKGLYRYSIGNFSIYLSGL
ncbi:MAG: lipid A deacylase LpxR family protein [Candidatus Pseudobacter hemicellulosilyticus]|uniref:Lipid A deacylase LpxR family protein n=1 Tax=Candidatus Pseudobacter hemicellulosilyticus TaxID=3121375 RepID=A0AAJ5WWI7_9BACT|nr:MAG: lipid A deacylase LpxR family protein [Pseudobacter sp.]